MLAHRLRRWPNINPTLGQHLVYAVSAGTRVWPRDLLLSTALTLTSSSWYGNRSSGREIIIVHGHDFTSLFFSRLGTYVSIDRKNCNVKIDTSRNSKKHDHVIMVSREITNLRKFAKKCSLWKCTNTVGLLQIVSPEWSAVLNNYSIILLNLPIFPHWQQYSFDRDMK